MKVLLYDWPSWTQTIIKNQLIKLYGSVDTFYYRPPKSMDINEELYNIADKKIKTAKYDFVFSVNYFPPVAKACYDNNTPYVAWSYDCPLNVTKPEDSLWYPTNYVFMFDKSQVNLFNGMGFSNVWHLPLAVDTAYFDKYVPTKQHYEKYGNQVAFVGQIYNSTYPKIIPPLDEFERNYLDTVIRAQTDLYGSFLIDQYLNDDIIDRVNLCYKNKLADKTFQVSKKQLSYSMSTYVTFKERVTILTLLSKRFDVALYSGDKHELFEKIKYKGEVSYDSQMPYVFKCSDINLNITVKCLQTGIPQRALDIMGCGGFLLSNYQEELLDVLVPDRDFVYYESFTDAFEKAKFYLEHEDLRKKIARSGYEQMKENYTFEDRFAFMASKCPFME